MNNTGGERRRFFRIDDQIPLSIQPVDDEGAIALKVEIDCAEETRASLASSFAAISIDMEPVLSRIRVQSPDLAGYLKAINQKLDALAGVLLMEDQDEGGLAIAAVDLSSAGLALDWPVAFEVGQKVRVELITRAAAARVLALGHVVTCEPVAFEPDHASDQTHHQAQDQVPAETREPFNGYHMAVDFDYIRPRDEDFIMQEVMHRQAALLRAHREERKPD